MYDQETSLVSPETVHEAIQNGGRLLILHDMFEEVKARERQSVQ